MTRALRIDVWFDLICPWCLIGKRQLERALADFERLYPQQPVEVHWRSQQLLPDLPPGGLPFREFYLRRLGGPVALAARQAQVRDAGLKAGLSFDFDNIPVMPNTLAAHGLIADARGQRDGATVDGLIENLFEAHFMRGGDLGDAALLARLASRHGIRQTGAPPLLDSMAPSVPLFLVDQRLPLSGAQAPERLLALMLQATVRL